MLTVEPAKWPCRDRYGSLRRHVSDGRGGRLQRSFRDIKEGIKHDNRVRIPRPTDEQFEAVIPSEDSQSLSQRTVLHFRDPIPGKEALLPRAAIQAGSLLIHDEGPIGAEIPRNSRCSKTQEGNK